MFSTVSAPEGPRTAMEGRRLEILRMIWDRELSVGEIASRLPVSGPAVSQHLARLRAAELVHVRAEGRHRYYRAAKERMGSLSALLESLWAGVAPESDGAAEPAASREAPAPGARTGGQPVPAALPSRAPRSERGSVGPATDSSVGRADEMATWYRQGLGARLTTLNRARAALGEASSGSDGAEATVRRIARSLVRVPIDERFPSVSATARVVADSTGRDLVDGVDRLIGVMRQAVSHDDERVARILVVEDSRVEALLNRQILSAPNREIVLAETAEAARECVDSERVDLIVLDLTLPGVDGRDLLMELGVRPRTASIPVILLTSRADTLTRTESISLGADAYYTKPVDRDVLAATVAMMLERAAETRQIGREDPLTGLRNRSIFLDDLRQRAAAARRSGENLALGLMEIDRLAAINDFHGSGVGDRILRVAADGIRSSFRESDSVARWGGAQFAVLFSGSNAEGAAAALAKLRDVTDGTPVEAPDGSDVVGTWHAGTASIVDEGGVDDLIAAATRRLQAARRHAAGTVITSDGSRRAGPSTVLLVEDDEILADLIEHRLRRDDFDVVRLADGAEALSAMPQIDASVVVLDTMLPGADGFEVLAKIRASPSYAGVPVVMLTFGGPDDAARAFSLGASDSLAKPFSVEELVARVFRLAAEFEGTRSR